MILSGHRAAEAAAHAAGEDEETARRFGWWPDRSTPHSVLSAYASRRVAEAAGFTAAEILLEEGEERVRYVRSHSAV